MLRLVHPAREGQGTDPPKRRKGRRAPTLSLTAEEVRHLRAALRNIARAYGSTAMLARALGITACSLKNCRKNGYRLSGIFAIRLASAAGVSVESLLSGTMSEASRCETCGHRPGTGQRLVTAGKSEEPRPWPTGGGAA